MVELGVIIIFAVAALLRYLDNKKPQNDDIKKSASPVSMNTVSPNEVKESLLSE